MMNAIRNSSRMVMLLFVLTVFAPGCKSKKKAMEASRAAEEKARLEQEAKLSQQQEEEARRKQEEEERARREAELKQQAESAPKARLNQYFSAISGASNTTAANNSINEALTLFSSPDTPVLIVISETNGQKDYDRPTTIRSYLNYLKDTKQNANQISNLQFDGSGKITEVELKKN
jgi:hypothetical protein